MSSKKLLAGTLLLVIALGVSSACTAKQPQRKTVCGGLVPAQAVRQLLDADRLYPKSVTAELGPNEGTVNCSIGRDKESPAYAATIRLSTVANMFDINGLPERLDKKPRVKGGKVTRIGIGKGTMGVAETWVYAPCDDTEWYVHIEAPEGNDGSRDAMRTIVKSLLNALQKHKDCSAGGSPSEPAASSS